MSHMPIYWRRVVGRGRCLDILRHIWLRALVWRPDEASSIRPWKESMATLIPSQPPTVSSSMGGKILINGIKCTSHGITSLGLLRQTARTIRSATYSRVRTGSSMGNRVLTPWNIPVSTKYGQTTVVLIPGARRFSSTRNDSSKPTAAHLLAQ